ncbi:hypothetical protein D3C79_810830 [compost metagenome]
MAWNPSNATCLTCSAPRSLSAVGTEARNPAKRSRSWQLRSSRLASTVSTLVLWSEPPRLASRTAYGIGRMRALALASR